jgi:hypothetical protein
MVDLRWQYYFQIADGLSPDPRIYTENRGKRLECLAKFWIYLLFTMLFKKIH